MAEEENARLRPLAERAELAEANARIFGDRAAELQRAVKVLEAQNHALWGVWREYEENRVHVPLAAVMERINAYTQVATQEWHDPPKAA